MKSWQVAFGSKTYEVEAETRAKAIVKAAHLYITETGIKYNISGLLLEARTHQTASVKAIKPPMGLV